MMAREIFFDIISKAVLLLWDFGCVTLLYALFFYAAIF